MDEPTKEKSKNSRRIRNHRDSSRLHRNEIRSLTIVTVLLIASSLTVLSGYAIPNANACAPVPASSQSVPNCCGAPSTTDTVVETVQQWTPEVVANSPYLGQVQASSGGTTGLSYSVGIVPLGTASTSSTTTVHIINVANGEATGWFKLATWERHNWVRDTCAGSVSGMYSKVASWGLAEITHSYAQPGTTADSNLPAQFSQSGYQSIQFDMRFEPGSNTVYTQDTTCSSPGQSIAASGTLSNSVYVFLSVSVTIGVVSLEVGQFSLSYQSSSQYDYVYTFNQGAWQWHYLGGTSYLRAFSYLGGGACSDFGVSANPISLSIPQGGSGTSTITVNSVNGFTGTVMLSAAQSPSSNNLNACFHGQTCTSSTDSINVNLAPGGTTSVPLTVSVSCGSAPPGSYSVAVTGASSNPSMSHSITIPVTVNGPVCDFAVSASPSSVSIQQGYSAVSQITVTSVNGFGGTVALTATPSVSVCGFTALFPGNLYGCNGQGSTTVSVASGGSTSVQLNIGVCLSTSPGAYSVSVSGASGSLSHATTIAVQVLSGPGCDSGSVEAGTLISLANGTQVRVENLRPGMLLLSYNVTTNRFTTSTITVMQTVPTDDKLVIHTEDGPVLVTDNATIQKLWVRQANGNTGWLSVTQLRVGDYLCRPLKQEWTMVDHLDLTLGSYTMYDIYTTAPGNYIANGYLDPVK